MVIVEIVLTIFLLGRNLFGFIGVLLFIQGLILIIKYSRTISILEYPTEIEGTNFDKQIGIGKIISSIAFLLPSIYPSNWTILLFLPIFTVGSSIQLIHSPKITYLRKVSPLFARKEDKTIESPTLEIIKNRKKRVFRNLEISLFTSIIISNFLIISDSEQRNQSLSDILFTIFIPILCFSPLMFAAFLNYLWRRQYKGKL